MLARVLPPLMARVCVVTSRGGGSQAVHQMHRCSSMSRPSSHTRTTLTRPWPIIVAACGRIGVPPLRVPSFHATTPDIFQAQQELKFLEISRRETMNGTTAPATSRRDHPSHAAAGAATNGTCENEPR